MHKITSKTNGGKRVSQPRSPKAAASPVPFIRLPDYGRPDQWVQRSLTKSYDALLAATIAGEEAAIGATQARSELLPELSSHGASVVRARALRYLGFVVMKEEEEAIELLENCINGLKAACLVGLEPKYVLPHRHRRALRINSLAARDLVLRAERALSRLKDGGDDDSDFLADLDGLLKKESAAVLEWLR
ncbi:MAG: hypothetical protein K2W95_35925 [Candidatus Obscuribacterales bacterium]|nr:hypothetical protein [Candidatus Obscuribacterales bacterium]